MEKIPSVLKGLFLIFIAFILTLISYLLFGYLQHIAMVHDDFLLRTVNFPVTTVTVIFELVLIISLYYLFHKPFRDHIKSVLLKITFVETFRKPIIRSIVAIIFFCFYSMITAVTVITPDKIIDHSFLHPLGREFTYEDVVKIDAKVQGERFLIPFSYSEGEFFYVIELNDGKKINLNSVGGTGDYEHEVFVIEKIDQKLVQMGVPKNSSMDHFELTTENLGKVYTDGIRRILENTE